LRGKGGKMTDEKTEKWRAVLQNDSRYDGRFFYAVKSTGIFCRPSCASKAPLEANVEYFDTAQAALNAGYQPCKRCRPDRFDHQPLRDKAKRAKAVMDRFYRDKIRLAQEFAGIGLSPHRMAEIFKAEYGVTPNEYADRLRIEAARDKLAHSGAPVMEIALFLGFESLTAFYGFFRKHTQMTPVEFRKAQTAQTSFPFWYPYETRLGRLIIAADDVAITAIRFADLQLPRKDRDEDRMKSSLTDRAAEQLEEYAARKRKQFELPLSPAGTAFQQLVWQALATIPYGETRSYRQIAAQVGNAAASRAVGMANNRNPIAIVIPCHRVIGANGALVGYAGGLEMKKRLLTLEAQYR
jgi:AraC family transcriptional regulator of adaptative response/methylated-DNA-[protein]-cysteine methyltransferase